MEWMRADDDTDTNWACFLVFDDDHVDVLAVISPKEQLDGRMTLAAARALSTDLRARGWHRATDAEIGAWGMTHKRLREIAYARRRP
jgi:hypothetical protein